jgi:hypothetical protein
MELRNKEAVTRDCEILPPSRAAYGENGVAPVVVNEVKLIPWYFSKEFVTREGGGELVPSSRTDQFNVYESVASAA